MTRALLNSVRRAHLSALLVTAVLVLLPIRCWADPITFHPLTTISGGGAVNLITPIGFEDGHFDLGSFSHSTESLGPVTLSDAIGDGFTGTSSDASSTISSVTRPSGIHVSGSTKSAARAGQDPFL